MKKQNGFTMVELLATIVLIGLLALIVIPSVSSVIDKVRNQYYKTLEDNVELAGRDYFSANRSARPTALGTTSVVALQKLTDDKYIEDVVSSKGKSCSGRVIAYRNNNNKTEYQACLICEDEYETNHEYCEPSFDPTYKLLPPTVTLTANYKEYTGAWTNFNVTQRFFSENATSYEYSTSENGPWITIKSGKTETNELNEMRYVRAKDNYKNVSEATSYQLKIDKKMPTVEFPDPDGDEGFKINSSDKTIVVSVSAYDVDSGINMFTYCISTDNSTCDPINNPENYTTLEDDKDGNRPKEYKKEITIKSGQKICARAYDRAGNISDVSCSAAYFSEIDCPVFVANRTTDWTNQNVKITIKPKKSSTSYNWGLLDYAYPPNYFNFISKHTGEGSVELSSEGYVTGRVQLLDKDDNVIKYCDTYRYQIDKTKPKVSIGSRTTINNGYRVTLTATDCNADNGETCSGIDYIIYCQSANGTNCNPTTKVKASGNKKFSTTVDITTESQTNRVCMSAVDKAGNASIGDNGSSVVCTGDIPVGNAPSTSAPGCPTITATSSAGKWTNKSITLTITPTTKTASWDWYISTNGGSYSKKNTYSGANEREITLSDDGMHAFKIVVKNSSGATRTCYTGQYLIDKQKPECTTSGGSTTYALNRGITVTCTDKGSSGCTSAMQYKWYEDTEITTDTYTVKDNAGNTATCTADVYVSNKKPTVTFSMPSNFPANRVCDAKITYTITSKLPITKMTWSGTGVKVPDGSCSCYNTTSCNCIQTVRATTDKGSKPKITLTAINAAGANSYTVNYNLKNGISCP